MSGSGSPRRKAPSNCPKMSLRINLDQVPFQDKILEDDIKFTALQSLQYILLFLDPQKVALLL